MAVLTRTNYIPNTLIQSSPVNADFNQLVDLLSGVSTTKDALIKFSDGSNPVLRVDQLGAGLIQQWLNNGSSRATLSALGRLTLPAGIGATPTSLATDSITGYGTYFLDPTARLTAANTNETDFSTKTVAANVLAANGDFLSFMCGVLFAANGNNKRYRIYFGSQVIYDTGVQAFNNVALLVQGYAYRAASDTITGFLSAIGTGGAGVGVTFTNVTGQNFATSNTLKSTGQNGTASAGDITQFGFNVFKGSI